MHAYIAEVDELILKSQEEAKDMRDLATKEAEIEQLRRDIQDGDNKVKANMAAKMKLKLVTMQVTELENSIKASAQETTDQEQKQKSELASVRQAIADVKTSLQTVDTSNSHLEADLKEPTAAIGKVDAELINLRQVVKELDDEIKVNTAQKAQLKRQLDQCRHDLTQETNQVLALR